MSRAASRRVAALNLTAKRPPFESFAYQQWSHVSHNGQGKVAEDNVLASPCMPATLLIKKAGEAQLARVARASVLIALFSKAISS